MTRQGQGQGQAQTLQKDGSPRAAFGPFELDRRIGQGGMAEVWKATYRGDAGFTKSVAVKRIRPDLMDNPEIAAVFEDEARVGGRLHHPTIVEVYDHGRIDGTPYLSMELVDGIGLDTVLYRCRQRGTPLPHLAVVEIGLQICEGLAHVHDAVDEHGRPLGIVHRDLTPSNILIDRSGRVRLIDFGVAQAATNRAPTRPDIVRGTPCYLSPEACYGRPASPRSDLFALAAILAEATVGHRIFHERDDINTLRRIISVDLRDTLDRVAAVNPALAECLTRALKREPARRTPDARAFRQDLLAAVDGPTGSHVLLGAVEEAMDPDPRPRPVHRAVPRAPAVTTLEAPAGEPDHVVQRGAAPGLWIALAFLATANLALTALKLIDVPGSW